MISVKSVLHQVPDPRGKQGLQHQLEALLGLILLSMLSGRKGMRATFVWVAPFRAGSLICWAFADT